MKVFSKIIELLIGRIGYSYVGIKLAYFGWLVPELYMAEINQADSFRIPCFYIVTCQNPNTYIK
ncbi:hypothetical protein B7C51_09095 [Paenibacillus larvae subsp. pulvifaciens]|uniref:Uncharacterized protein n=1 Tax=Paenibacillus larvae subsp. pulvifaciens TaxID=1477 RepID=A0A1V0USE2_9BACL|nr:hypothetical protein B7C51_09095 [Paenibacillus larvae subsp. pulvifaciens]